MVALPLPSAERRTSTHKTDGWYQQVRLDLYFGVLAACPLAPMPSKKTFDTDSRTGVPFWTRVKKKQSSKDYLDWQANGLWHSTPENVRIRRPK
jgi:hypothetical protein